MCASIYELHDVPTPRRRGAMRRGEREKAAQNVRTHDNVIATHQAAQCLTHEPANEQLFWNGDVIRNVSDCVAHGVQRRRGRIL